MDIDRHCCLTFLPLKGCRSTSVGEPLATDCNACRFLKNSVTGECLEKCPEGWKKKDDNTCVKGKFHQNEDFCNVSQQFASTEIHCKS